MNLLCLNLNVMCDLILFFYSFVTSTVVTLNIQYYNTIMLVTNIILH